MRVPMRETGSIVVKVPAGDVVRLIAAYAEGSHVVAPDRVEARVGTFVVRDGAAGTQVFHARTGSTQVPRAGLDRESLRRELKVTLFDLQRIVDLHKVP